MIKGQRVEWADIAMANEEEVVGLKGASFQLAWFTLVFHGLVGVVHVRKIHMPHGLAHCFVAVDAAEFLMIKEEDANVEDKRY